MGGEYKLVLATQYFFCQLHPDLMGFLSGNLPRLKGLDQVAAQVRALVNGMAACPFKFNVGGLGGASEGAHQQFPVRLVGIADMLLISSRFENMWVPLGIGVAGFLSGMALANSGLTLLLVHPFVIILKPAVAMSAQPDPTVALVALAETLLFLAVGLWLAKYRRYE